MEAVLVDQFEGMDATAQASLVREKQVTPVELVEAAIERIKARNPVTNAVVATRFEDALREAASPSLPDGPFRGVPFLIKDIGATQQGLPYYMGSRVLRDMDYRSEADTVLGARFRQAGFVTLGKTNTPELGSSPTTQPLSFGPTNNPWDLTRSPSGSSGGPAVAVASGMVPVAHANDGGGSIRLPASWCGLVGLKPSRGRMPRPSSISRLVTELVVSRTVRDTAAVLDATCGPTEADLYQIEPPRRSYLKELNADPGRLRIGLLTDGGGFEVDSECVTGARRAAKVLQSMGHSIDELPGAMLFDSEVNGTLWMAALTRQVDALGEMAGRPVTENEVEPYNWAAAERGRSFSAADWTRAQEQQQAWVTRVLEQQAPYDLLVTPTSGCPPMRTEDLRPDEQHPWRIGRTYGRIGRFTLPFNATGQPAISLPLHWTASGLPVGVQLVAHLGHEDTLLRVAARLEEAMPWADRRPPAL